MNPFKKMWQGLRFAGRNASKGFLFAEMLGDMGVPIPFIQYMKLGMTLAELGSGKGRAKASQAKRIAIRIAKERGVDVSRVPNEAIDLLIQLLLSPVTNASPELSFSVGDAAEALKDFNVFSASRAFESRESYDPATAEERSSTRQRVLDEIAAASVRE